jgi:hypothetical protein
MNAADKTAGLRAARARDSQHKRQRVLAALDSLEAAASQSPQPRLPPPPEYPPGWSMPTDSGRTATPPGDAKPTGHDQPPTTRRR